MSVTFTKLFSSITESTIWTEPDHVRLTWITMLAMADRKGRVFGSIPGLANRARVSVENCEDAIMRFMSPDKYSRTKVEEGKRIREIDGGWILINHAKYREIRDEETAKEQKRNYINNRRAKERAEKMGVEIVENVDRGRDNAEADTEAKAEADPSSIPKKQKVQFVKPSLEEVKIASAEKGLPPLEAENFWNHHEMRDWKINGKPMVKWRLALSTWFNNWSSGKFSSRKQPNLPNLTINNPL